MAWSYDSQTENDRANDSDMKTKLAAKIQPLDPLPELPTNIDEVVDILVAYGLCEAS